MLEPSSNDTRSTICTPVMTTRKTSDEGSATWNRFDAASPSQQQNTTPLSTTHTESPFSDSVGSNRPSPIIQQQQSMSVPGMLQQPSLNDSATEPLKKGRFTVSPPDAPPAMPVVLERAASVATAPPAPVQKGRFTVGQIPISSDYSVATAPPAMATAVVPAVPKKKGRFVVSSPRRSALSVDGDPALQYVEVPSSIPVQVTTVPQPPIEPLGQPPPSAAQLGSQNAPPDTLAPGPLDVSTGLPLVAVLSEEATTKATIMNGAAPRENTGKPPASFDSKGVGSTVGLGKVFYFLEQMKTEVSEADRSTKLLQKEVKFLKEKNKELEAKSREMERRWKDQKVNREAAEAKVRFLKKKLREVKEPSNDEELLPLAGENIDESASSSIEDVEELKILNKGYQSDHSGGDGAEKPTATEGGPGGTPFVAALTRRSSTDGLNQAAAASSPKAKTATNSRPPMADSSHIRHKSTPALNGYGHMANGSDDKPTNFTNPTHNRAASNTTGMMGMSSNGGGMHSGGAAGINGGQQTIQPMMGVQQPQQAWGKSQYPIKQQQQPMQKPPMKPQQQQQALMSQGAAMNHQMMQQHGMQQQAAKQTMSQQQQQQQQQGMQAMSQQQQSQQTMQGMPQQQQPQGKSTIVQHNQQPQGMQSMSQQQAQQAFMTQQQQPMQSPNPKKQQPMQQQPSSLQQQQQSMQQQQPPPLQQQQQQPMQQQPMQQQPPSLQQQQKPMQQNPQPLQQQQHQPMQQQPPSLQQQQQSMQQQQPPSLQQQQHQSMQQQPSIQHQSMQQQQQQQQPPPLHQQQHHQQQQQQQQQPMQQQQQPSPLLNTTMTGNANGQLSQQQQQQQFAHFNQQQQPMQPTHNPRRWS